MSAAVYPEPPKWRWAVAVVAVALLHGAGYLLMRDIHPTQTADIPQDAVMLDLAPATPAAPTPAAAPPQQAPPLPPPDLAAPEPVPPPPEPPSPPAEVAPPPPSPPAMIPDRPEVVLPPPPPRRQVVPRPTPRPFPPHVRPPSRPMRDTPVQAAPVEAPPAPPAAAAKAATTPGPASSGAEAATWASKLAAHLLRFRYYPPDAERRGMAGVVMMRFSVDASGHLVSHSMVRSSGHDLLDEAASAWLERAQPLPPPPADRVAPAQVVVPMAFVLH